MSHINLPEVIHTVTVAQTCEHTLARTAARTTRVSHETTACTLARHSLVSISRKSSRHGSNTCARVTVSAVGETLAVTVRRFVPSFGSLESGPSWR